MLVDDDYEHVEYNNDRTDVIVVSRSGSEEEPESEPLANDCRDSFLIVVAGSPPGQRLTGVDVNRRCRSSCVHVVTWRKGLLIRRRE